MANFHLKVVSVTRLGDGPLICQKDHPLLGGNVNGPSVITAPVWARCDDRYLMYFAHHRGQGIRLATADAITGPWRILPEPVLHIDQTIFNDHIASPDAHVDHRNRRIVMYFHGSLDGCQFTCAAVSDDGLSFQALPQRLGRSYFRVWQWKGFHYALAMPGIIYRSRDGLSDFYSGPKAFAGENQRRTAVRLVGDILQVFHSDVGECPERIKLSTIDLMDDWMSWQAGETVDALSPEFAWEGSDAPKAASARGWAPEPAWQLRDPCIFEDEGRLYLFYSFAGEQGIAVAEVTFYVNT